MNGNSTDQSIIEALDGNDTKLVKYIPYILQDFWEIGTPPDDIIEIIRKHTKNHSSLSVLDLGSGKGAVSVNLALELQCKCLGIDALEDFVLFSNKKAREYYVDHICTFEKDDIRNRLETLGKYDVIILGAIGPVFGNYFDTLSRLKPHLKNGGLIIINDAYIDENCNANQYPAILKKSEILTQTKNAGMALVEVLTDVNGDELDEGFKIELENLSKRCMELADTYPEDTDLFLDYVEKQKREYEILSNEIVPALFVFRHIEDI